MIVIYVLVSSQTYDKTIICIPDINTDENMTEFLELIKHYRDEKLKIL